jgi:multidrug efflux system membrane fusion protein
MRAAGIACGNTKIPLGDKMARVGAIVLSVLAVSAVAGGAVWYENRAPATAASPAARPAAAVPVLAGVAARADVPIYLSGLGTVQAFNTVTVRARVDGHLDKIAFVEGQDVKAGDLLAQIDPRPLQAALNQAVATKATDEAKLANAKLDLERFNNLIKRDFATHQSVDTQNAMVAQLEAAIQGDQAAIDNARVQLGYTTITAPLGGRTGLRLIDQGNIVHAGDTNGIVMITQLQPISVIFILPQDLLGQIHDEMTKGTLTVTALKRDDPNQVIDQGTLALVDNQIDAGTGTIHLKATFPNRNNALWPGEAVSARLTLKTERGAVTVPAPVVQRDPAGTYVYVIKPDETVERRAVAIAQIRDDVAIIDKGLEVGERVVVDGQYKLRPGIRVDTTQDAPKAVRNG